MMIEAMKEPGDEPLVTVIVAVFNGEATLERCLESISSQIYPKKEVIVIDGGSTDRTIDILRRNSHKISYWESKPDKGIYHAWNKAIAKSHGDWICFLGADDYFWSNTVLSDCMVVARRIYPKVRVIYGRIALVRGDGSLIRFIGAPWEQTKNRFKQLSSIPHPGLLCHRKVFEERGKFDESFRISGDYEFLLRELLEREAHFMPDLISVGMGNGGISSRSRTIRLGYEECRRAQRMHNIRRIGWYWIVGYGVALSRWVAAKIIGEARVDQLVHRLREGS